MKDLDKLAPDFVALQADLAPVDKSADNPFFKSKFAPLPEVRKAMQPVLAKHNFGLATFPTIVYDVDGNPHNGLHFYLIHASGQYLDGEWMLTPAKRDPQGEGADTTYKRRYAEMAITGLVADEDDDGHRASVASEPSHPMRSKGNVALERAKTKLREAVKSSGVDSSEYAWVANATSADVDKINGLAEALSLGRAVG